MNEAWITASFHLEDEDVVTLGDPQHHILHGGGRIFFAIEPQSSQILRCCALPAMEEGCYEVAKMAIARRHRGQGLGKQLLHGTIDAARSLGTRRLYLVTHHSLRNAIELYESEGFVHLRTEDAPPSPYARDHFHGKVPVANRRRDTVKGIGASSRTSPSTITRASPSPPCIRTRPSAVPRTSWSDVERNGRYYVREVHKKCPIRPGPVIWRFDCCAGSLGCSC